jgi:hypothetical protein
MDVNSPVSKLHVYDYPIGHGSLKHDRQLGEERQELIKD